MAEEEEFNDTNLEENSDNDNESNLEEDDFWDDDNDNNNHEDYEEDIEDPDILNKLNNFNNLSETEKQQVKQVTTIDLCCKGLTEISSNIGEFTNLKKLNLGENNLTSLPESICNLTQLIELEIHSNPNLKKIPNCFKNLVNLKYFAAGFCGLTEIPQFIRHLSNLNELWLGENKIGVIDDSILHMPQDSEIYLGSQMPENNSKTIIIDKRVYKKFKNHPEILNPLEPGYTYVVQDLEKQEKFANKVRTNIRNIGSNNTNSSIGTLSSLPNSNLENIALYLDPKSLGRLTSTNKTFNALGKKGGKKTKKHHKRKKTNKNYSKKNKKQYSKRRHLKRH